MFSQNNKEAENCIAALQLTHWQTKKIKAQTSAIQTLNDLIKSPKAVFNLEKAGIEEVITDFIETVLMQRQRQRQRVKISSMRRRKVSVVDEGEEEEKNISLSLFMLFMKAVVAMATMSPGFLLRMGVLGNMGSQLLEICQYLQVEHADGPIPDLSAATAVMKTITKAYQALQLITHIFVVLATEYFSDPENGSLEKEEVVSFFLKKNLVATCWKLLLWVQDQILNNTPHDEPLQLFYDEFFTTVLSLVSFSATSWTLATRLAREGLVDGILRDHLVGTDATKAFSSVVHRGTLLKTIASFFSHGEEPLTYIALPEMLIDVLNFLDMQVQQKLPQSGELYTILSILLEYNDSVVYFYPEKRSTLTHADRGAKSLSISYRIAVLWEYFYRNISTPGRGVNGDVVVPDVDIFKAMLKFHIQLLEEISADKLRILRKVEREPFILQGSSEDCVALLFQAVLHEPVQGGSKVDQSTLAMVSEVVKKVPFSVLNVEMVERMTTLTLGHLETSPFPTPEESHLLFILLKFCIDQNSTIMARIVSPRIVASLSLGTDESLKKTLTTHRFIAALELTLPFSLRLNYTSHLLIGSILDSPIHGNFIVASGILRLYPPLMKSINVLIQERNKKNEIKEAKRSSKKKKKGINFDQDDIEEREDFAITAPLEKWILEMVRLLLVLLCTTSSTVKKQLVAFKPPLPMMCLQMASELEKAHHVQSMFGHEIEATLYLIVNEFCERNAMDLKVVEKTSLSVIVEILRAIGTTISDNPCILNALLHTLRLLSEESFFSNILDDITANIVLSIVTNFTHILSKVLILYVYSDGVLHVKYDPISSMASAPYFKNIMSIVMEAESGSRTSLFRYDQVRQLKLWLRNLELASTEVEHRLAALTHKRINGADMIKNLLNVLHKTLKHVATNEDAKQDLSFRQKLEKLAALLVVLPQLAANDASYLLHLTSVLWVLREVHPLFLPLREQLQYLYGSIASVTVFAASFSSEAVVTEKTSEENENVLEDLAGVMGDLNRCYLELLSFDGDSTCDFAIKAECKLLVFIVLNALNELLHSHALLSLDSHDTVHVDLEFTRQHVPLLLDQLGTVIKPDDRTSKLLLKELYGLLQDASRLPYTELHSRWQSLILQRPHYPPGLISLQTLAQLKQGQSLEEENVDKLYATMCLEEESTLGQRRIRGKLE